MSRKYRQQGYQDTDRERKPKPPPRPKGAEGRVETRFNMLTRCNNCAAEVHVTGSVQATDKCSNCGTDLHTCRNCLHFDPSARNECVKPVEIRVTNKSANNICTYFECKVLIEKKGSDAGPKKESSHRQAFHDLFKS
jgi:hypothetical protein